MHRTFLPIVSVSELREKLHNVIDLDQTSIFQAKEIVSEKTGKSVLDKFCHWINYDHQIQFPHEQTHDLAVYITRRDIGPAGMLI